IAYAAKRRPLTGTASFSLEVRGASPQDSGVPELERSRFAADQGRPLSRSVVRVVREALGSDFRAGHGEPIARFAIALRVSPFPPIPILAAIRSCSTPSKPDAIAEHNPTPRQKRRPGRRSLPAVGCPVPSGPVPATG